MQKLESNLVAPEGPPGVDGRAEGKEVAIAETLNLEGVPCPHNTAKAAVALLMLDEGEVLELLIDDGEPIENVPDSLEFEGHEVLLQERRGAVWRLLVRRGDV